MRVSWLPCGPREVLLVVLQEEALCGARMAAAAPGLHPLCEILGFFSSKESHLLIFWAAFPSVLPGGGRALEISIVA